MRRGPAVAVPFGLPRANDTAFEVELEEDDERVQGAAELVVLPTQGMPATAHVQVEWSGAFTFTVPVQAG